VLLAYQIARNWHGRINLCMAVADVEIEERANQFLRELISLARLPRHTSAYVTVGAFWEALPQAPRSDLSIFGLQTTPDLNFVEKISTTLSASCIFVRDSGNESALA